MEMRQRSALHKTHGNPIVSIDFEGFSDGHVSMFQHTFHDQDYYQVKTILIKFRDHLDKFIQDEGMCPFNPEFKE